MSVLRKRTWSFVATIFAATWLTSGILTAQSAPLPERFEDGFFGPGQAAMSMHLPGAGGDLMLYVRFKNDDELKGLQLEWNFNTANSQRSMREDFEATSFKPTAVCRRSGESSTLYVAGWNERTASVIVEQWDFSNYQVIGPPITPESDPNNPTQGATLGGPGIQKTLLFACGSMQPIAGMACNYYANELWILEQSAPEVNAGYVYNLSSSQATCAGLTLLHPGVLSSPISSSYAPMADKTTLTAMDHPLDGFFIYFEHHRPWVSPYNIPAPYNLVVFRDIDRDGEMEEVVTQTYTQFYTQRPLVEFDHHYN